jgi:hypothetical protein
VTRSPRHVRVRAVAWLAAAVTCAAVTCAGAGAAAAPTGSRAAPASPGTGRGPSLAAPARPAGLMPGLSHGADRLSRRGVRIGFAGSAGPGAVRPSGPLRTLTVRGVNLAGKPDSGDQVAVENVNDPAPLSRLLGTLHIFHHGTVTVRVPPGTYWAVGIFSRDSVVGLDRPPAGQPAAASKATRLVVLPQFTVSGSRTVTVDERAAASRLSVTAPRPTVPADVTIAFERISAGGKRLTVSASPLLAKPPVYVSTTSHAPADGTLYSFTADQLLSPPGAAASYQYDVAYKGPRGLVPAQHFRISAASLATIHENLYSGAPGNGSFVAAGTYPAASQSVELLPKLRVPGRLTIYLSAVRSIYWQGTYFQVYRTVSAGQYDQPVAYRPGQVVTENWNAYPLHVAPNVRLPGTPISQGLSLMSADRSQNILTLDFMPFSDSVSGHLGSGYQPVIPGTVSGSYRIRQNGRTIAAGNALNAHGLIGGEFYRQVGLTAKPSVLSFTLTAKRTGRFYPLSTASSTTWTWHSVHEAGDTVPSGWVCSDAANRDCRAEPLLTLAYAVRGLALDGRTAPGAQVVTVRVGHLQLAATPKITKVTAQVSADGGKTWTRAAVTGSAGTYRARFTAHPGNLVTLRVTAADAAGGRISETITRAYGIAS